MRGFCPFEGWLLAVVLGVGCGPTTSAVPADETEPEEPVVVVTQWTGITELFMEYPPLVVNQTSRFAIHLTDLETFAAVATGRVVVSLDGDTAIEFVTDSPAVPGIFGVDVTPTVPGRYRLAIRLEGEGLRDVHDVGSVTVQADARSVVLPPDEDPGRISFLKEQQWVLDFATASAELREMAESLVVAAEIEPRTGGRVDVTTPVAGRIAGDLPARPVGSQVAAGDTLAEIIPHSGHGEDRPALELAVAEARDALELARAERARVERLVDVGAIPTRRQLEARVTEQTAEARVTAAEAHLAQLDATRTGEGVGSRDIRFVLRAPMSGVVAESDATPGASVEEGTRLFRLVALDRVHVVGALPEAVLPRVDELIGAELELPGVAEPVALDRLIAIGRVLDPQARTVPIIYELRKPDRRLAIGQAVSLRLFVSDATEAVTVPESAIVDDAGQPVVFVQMGGESFDRRPVQLGNREAGMVQISGDVEPGERVVVAGAPLIRLASLSSQIPAHGHTH